MIINSLSLKYTGQTIVTDFDDTIIKSNKAIFKAGMIPRYYWFNPKLYISTCDKVFSNAEFTDWGIELNKLIYLNLIQPSKVHLVTVPTGRIELIKNKLSIPITNIHTGCSASGRLRLIELLSKQEKIIYVDDNPHNIERSKIYKCTSVWYNGRIK